MSSPLTRLEDRIAMENGATNKKKKQRKAGPPTSSPASASPSTPASAGQLRLACGMAV